MDTPLNSEKSTDLLTPQSRPSVVIDARMVGKIPHGIARYVMELCAGLELLSKQNNGLPYEPVFLVQPDSPIVKSFFKTILAHSTFLSLSELFELPKILSRTKASLFHSPSFSSLVHCPCPSVVTIHDLNHLTYGTLSKKLYYQLILKTFALKSKAIATVSQFSQGELAQWLKIAPQQIKVVYNSICVLPADRLNSKEAFEVLAKFKLKPKEFFFCLSNSKPHKNVQKLIEAFLAFRSKSLCQWPLVLSTEVLSGDPSFRFLGGITDFEAYVLLYHSAGLFFPSIYEGFGLPPVEAAALGVPLAISDIPPHREGLVDLQKNEVLWVQPQDLQSWVAAFELVSAGGLSGPSEKSRLQVQTRFSNLKLAGSMDQIYRDVLQLG